MNSPNADPNLLFDAKSGTGQDGSKNSQRKIADLHFQFVEMLLNVNGSFPNIHNRF